MAPYSHLQEIGHGGMGCVYKAQDANGKIVAIKMMSNKVTCYPEYRQLFQSEVDTLRRMNHPSVVHIVGDPYQDSNGNLYLPMEYVEGETIEQRVNANGAFPMEEAVDIMSKILEAMQYVHDRQRIHRDIKPSNIMIRPDGRICIIDFGIAKDAKIGTGQTVGRIIGTDGYMSPEQAKGLNIDRRTDIYSLGCVLYFLLTGKHAISKGHNDYETVCNILQSIPSLPSQAGAGISTRFDEIFMKAVDKNMTQRYQSASEFKEAIEEAVGKSVPKVSIGRASYNDIIIDDIDISRKHLTIRGLEQPMTGGTAKYFLEITDTSSNGTGVNGRLFKQQTMTIDYDGTINLPEVLLAGKPEFSIDWPDVISRLKAKGWTPEIYEKNVAGREIIPRQDERLNWFLCILCFLVPLVGWVLWGVYRKEYPRKASMSAILGWIGFATSFIVNIILLQNL